MEDKNRDTERVICPYCGYRMQITYSRGAGCKGLYVRCKGRSCRKVFEIKIKNGMQDR